LYRFAAGQDLRDRALFESAFAEDAAVDFTGPARRFGVALPVFHGRDGIVAAIMASTAELDTTHVVTNPRVVVEDDIAFLDAIVEAQHLPRDDHRRHLLLKNRYSVKLTRATGQWLIQHMVIDNVWFTGDPAVLLPGRP
jgi:hypothetical protein